jgi:hypothetical protein
MNCAACFASRRCERTTSTRKRGPPGPFFVATCGANRAARSGVEIFRVERIAS